MTRFCRPPTCLTGSKGLALDTAARSKPPASCRVYPVQLWKERAAGQQPDSSCNPQRCLPISPQCYMRSCRSRGFTQLHARVSNDLIDHDAQSCSSKSGGEGSQRDICGLFSPEFLHPACCSARQLPDQHSALSSSARASHCVSQKLCALVSAIPATTLQGRRLLRHAKAADTQSSPRSQWISQFSKMQAI